MHNPLPTVHWIRYWIWYLWFVVCSNEHYIHNMAHGKNVCFHVPSISNKTYLLGICWQRDFFYSQLIYKHAGK